MNIYYQCKTQADHIRKNINKSFREYKSDLSKKIRKLKSSNPKEYWNFLNGHTRSQNFRL